MQLQLGTHLLSGRSCSSVMAKRTAFFPTVSSPLPLSDQQELEKLASRKLRISAKETMKIAEKLYTQG